MPAFAHRRRKSNSLLTCSGGEGKDWWALMVRSRTEAEIECITWDGFKELFREQCVPQIAIERITREFLNMV